jgi:competence ComEA-like helix-hairpin-helix protein
LDAGARAIGARPIAGLETLCASTSCSVAANSAGAALSLPSVVATLDGGHDTLRARPPLSRVPPSEGHHFTQGGFEMVRMVLSIVAVGFLLAVHAPAATAQSKTSPNAATAKATAGKPVNINTASVADLDGLPGVGAKTAALIVEYRQKNGPFKKIEDLREVRRCSSQGQRP